MANLSHKFSFEFKLDVTGSKFDYISYKVGKDDNQPSQDVLPKESPAFFNHVIFDVLQKYSNVSEPIKLSTQMAYLFVDKSEEQDIVCIDVVTIDKDNVGNIPARYEISGGTDGTGGSGKYYIGDVYDCLISSKEKIKVINLRRTRDSRKKWWHRAGYISTECQVTKNDGTFTFNGLFTLRRHLLGEIAGAIPIPELPEDHCFPDHHVVVAHYHYGEKLSGNSYSMTCLSEAASRNLTDLSHLLQDRKPRVTWIMGDPGSGKEIFAQAIHYGSVQSRKGVLESRSAAGVTLQELNKRLYLAKSGKPCLIDDVNDGKVEDKDNVEKKYAPGGTIFLDEFDKVAETKDIYGSMLRVLEAKEFIKITDESGEAQSEEIKKCKKVNWLFAGAFSQSDPKETVPPDLWSRLTGFISIRNPLLNSPGYAATLFIFFYVRAVLEMIHSEKSGSAGCISKSGNFVDLLEKKPSERNFNERVVSALLGMSQKTGKDKSGVNIGNDAPIMPSKKLLSFAFNFAEYVNLEPVFRTDRIDSSRAIRQAALIAFSTVRDSAIEKENEFELNQDEIKEGLKAAKKALLVARGP